MPYKVLYGCDFDFEEASKDLEKQVENYKKQGYTPQGGIAITKTTRELYYVAQAVDKKE